MKNMALLRRSPSLPCSPLQSPEGSRFLTRKSPRRRSSLEGRPPVRSPPHRSPNTHRSPPSRSPHRRTIRGVPRRRNTSHSFDEILTVSSTGSTGSSSGVSMGSHSSPLNLPAGDSDEIPKGSMRKRGQMRNPSNILIRKTTSSSLSFRRKQNRKGFFSSWRTKKSMNRFLVILSMLFVLSFSMAFLTSRKPSESGPSSNSGVGRRRVKQPTQRQQNNDRLRKRITSQSTSSNGAVESSPSKTAKTPIRLRGTQKTELPKPSAGDAQPISSPAFERFSKSAPSCSPLSEDQVDFTVVTQLSKNRLWMMKYHCLRWEGAFSIAVYIPPNDKETTAASLQKDLEQMGCSVDRVAVTLVTGFSEEEYPVNVLRNRALEAVRTSHVVYVDIDFWESTDLYNTLQNHAKLLAEDPKQALVIPAFQLSRQCKDWRECPEDNIPMMPTDKDSLLDLMVDKKQANAFDPTNQGGHGSTRYRDWLDQDADEILPIKCVKSNRYEPYLVFRYCRDLPPFQEAFTGYGKNKMTWVMQLLRSGYKLGQLGESFVVHYPHLDSKARMHWNGGTQGQQLRRKPSQTKFLEFKRGQIDHIFVDFRSWLEATVPDETLIHKCKHALDDDEKLWISTTT